MIQTSSRGSLCQLAGELLHPEDVFPALPVFFFSISLKAVAHIEYVTCISAVFVCVYVCV